MRRLWRRSCRGIFAVSRGALIYDRERLGRKLAKNVIALLVAGMLHVADKDSILVQIVPLQKRDLLLAPRRENRKRDNFLHRYGGGAVVLNAPKVFHQAVKLFERWPTAALDGFSDQTQLFHHGQRIVEFLTRQWVTPGRSRRW